MIVAGNVPIVFLWETCQVDSHVQSVKLIVGATCQVDSCGQSIKFVAVGTVSSLLLWAVPSSFLWAKCKVDCRGQSAKFIVVCNAPIV